LISLQESGCCNAPSTLLSLAHTCSWKLTHPHGSWHTSFQGHKSSD
jgi:hypothetical protein